MAKNKKTKIRKEPIKTVWSCITGKQNPMLWRGTTRRAMQLRFNPIWRFKQWWYTHKGITFGAGEDFP